MNDQIGPADAARALREIDRRREQVIRRKVIPSWYWWANGVLMIALAAAVESGRGVVIWTGIALFVASALVINVPVSRAARAAPPRRGLAGPVRRTLVAMAALMLVLLGVAVATGLGLKAAGVLYPGTISAAVTAVLFAVGWQLLVRYEQAVRVRRSRSQG
jgi:hypothetical protein